MKISALVKGLITGCLMIAVSFLIYQVKKSFENNLQYITYALYVAGIIWAVADHHYSGMGNRKFMGYFSEGFRCFIVVVLLMVLFTYVFLQLHPEIKEEVAAQMRIEEMKSGNYTAAEIDTHIMNMKKYYTTILISLVIFMYLVIGAIVSAITSAIFARKNNLAKP